MSQEIKLVIDPGNTLTVNANVLKMGDNYILAMDWYQLGDQISTNRLWVKWRQLLKRLSGDISFELKNVLWIESPNSNYQEVEPILKNSWLIGLGKISYSQIHKFQAKFPY
jgi:hypothetical protein